MTSGLTGHQRAALTGYAELLRQHPLLFTGRPRRPIELDLQVVAEYALKHKVVLGVAAQTPQVLFVVDLVRSKIAGGGPERQHPYLRVISRAQLSGGENVGVLATIENSSLGRVGDVIMVKQERHAVGRAMDEIPRGFGESNVPGEVLALAELETETGFSGDSARLLGTTNIDSGMTDSTVAFYHVAITRRVKRRPEAEEAIVGVRSVARTQLWREIRTGVVQDSFTLQALALYEDFLGKDNT